MIKEILFNIPAHLGTAILIVAGLTAKLGNAFVGISYRLHVKSNTKTGKYLRDIEKKIKQNIKDIQSAAGVTTNKSSAQDNSIFKQEKEGEILNMKNSKTKNENKD